MPSGVEHKGEQHEHHDCDSVVISLMPSGVEHTPAELKLWGELKRGHFVDAFGR